MTNSQTPAKTQEVFINIKYEAGHTLQEHLKLDKTYCLNCGRQNVWTNQSEGDYYYGAASICSDCGAEFTFQMSTPTDYLAQQRLAAIKGIKNV